MFSANPTTKLREVPVGAQVMLPDDKAKRTFINAVIRPDGYRELHIRNRLVVTACGSTRVSVLDKVSAG